MGRNPKDPSATRTCRVALAVNAKISRGKTSAAVHNLIMLHPVKVRHLETGVHGRLAWRRSWESQGQSYAINFDGKCPLRVLIGSQTCPEALSSHTRGRGRDEEPGRELISPSMVAVRRHSAVYFGRWSHKVLNRNSQQYGFHGSQHINHYSGSAARYRFGCICGVACRKGSRIGRRSVLLLACRFGKMNRVALGIDLVGQEGC